MSKPELPRFIQLSSALQEFVTVEGTQAQQHIRPLHQYLTVRLVLEGGFDPGEITPHPPPRVERKGQRKLLRFAPDKEDNREQTLLGGLKSKAVDVVVTKEGIGPVLAISVKGTGNAFRNLTNRMEEAIGDSTNLHIMYPGLVYGFLHFLKANREGEAPLAPNDIALTESGEPVTAIRRYHDVLLGLAGRRLVRDDYTRYEAVGLAMVVPRGETRNQLLAAFPPSDSPLHFAKFFDVLYSVYDLRYAYTAASLTRLRRQEWDDDSPVLRTIASSKKTSEGLGYTVRMA
jgi:hypothetical protein